MKLNILLGAVAVLCSGLEAQAQESAPILIDSRTLTLPGGLRVVLARTEPRGDPPRVHIATYVTFGAAHESATGEAHLLEHLVASAPAPEGHAVPLPEGAQNYLSNAVTRANATLFVRTVSPDALAATLTSRMIRAGPVNVDTAILERERARVVQELERVRTNPRFGAYKALDALMRGRPAADLDSELSWVQTVGEASLKSVEDAVYRPDRSVLVVVGDIDLAQTEAMATGLGRTLGLEQWPPAERPLQTSPVTMGGRQTVAVQNSEPIFGAAIGYIQPAHDEAYPAFLVLDQLLMGGRTVTAEGIRPGRSSESPLARRLAAAVGAEGVFDGKEVPWGVPALAEGDPAVYAMVFQTASCLTPQAARMATVSALTDIRRQEMSDAEIEAAKSALATFYSLWLKAPDGLVLGAHLAAAAFDGRPPESVEDIPASILAVSPDAVREMMDRVLLTAEPAVAITAPRESSCT